MIRRMGPGDEASAVALLAAQMADHDIAISGDAVAACVRGLTEDPGRGFILLQWHEGRAVGVAYVAFTWSLEHGGRTAWLEELYVLPAARERGLGRTLLLEAMAQAKAAGCAAVDLEVATEHARAERLYEREGFGSLARRRWVRTL